MTDKDLVVTTILSSAIKCAAKALISRALRENTNKHVGEAALVAHWTIGMSVPWRGSGISGSVDTTGHLRCAACRARPSFRCFMPPALESLMWPSDALDGPQVTCEG